MQWIAVLAHAWLVVQTPVTIAAEKPVTAPAEQAAVTAPTEAPSAATAPAYAAAPSDATQVTEMPTDEMDEDGISPEGWEAEKDAQTGGGVAVVLGFYRPNMRDINQIAGALNFPGGFGNEALFMNGLHAYGYIGKYFRIGGELLTGSASISDPGADFDRSLRLDVDQGGITLEFVWPTQRFEVYGGGMIGVGSYSLVYGQNDLRGARANWDSLMDNFAGTPQTGTYSKSFSAGYTSAQPWLGVKYKVLPWFAIDANAGYHFGSIGRGEWTFSDDSGFGIANSPSLKASGLTGSLAVAFGFFPY